MPFSNAPYRRVARHLAERVNIVSEKQRSSTHSGRRQRSLCTSVASPYYDHIKLVRVNHPRNRRKSMLIRHYTSPRRPRLFGCLSESESVRSEERRVGKEWRWRWWLYEW